MTQASTEVNAELEQFKAEVAAVARRYASQHGLCEVVNRALEEMGIGNSMKTVYATFSVGGTLSFEVDELAFSVMTDEQKAQFLKDRIVVDFVGNQLRVRTQAPGGAGIQHQTPQEIRLTKEDVIISTVTDEAPAGTPTPPTEIAWWRLVSTGRVLHAIRPDQQRRAQGGHGYAQSVCERQAAYIGHWDTTPPANTYPYCVRCSERLAR